MLYVLDGVLKDGEEPRPIVVPEERGVEKVRARGELIVVRLGVSVLVEEPKRSRTERVALPTVFVRVVPGVTLEELLLALFRVVVVPERRSPGVSLDGMRVRGVTVVVPALLRGRFPTLVTLSTAVFPPLTVL